MNVLIKPLITEKVAALADEGKYGFIVDRRANKLQIKAAVEEMYGVTVTSVNTMVAVGKPKNRYTRGGMVSGRTSTYKKAIVKLAEGEVFDFYSGI